MKIRFSVAKKKSIDFLLLFCLLALTITCHSQSIIELRVGKCYSKFAVKNGNGYKFYDFSNRYDHAGYLVDFTYSNSLNRYISIKPTIGYIKRGAIIKKDYGWVGFDKFSLNYINTSAIIGVSPIKAITLNFGINYNYLINSKAYYGKDGVGTTTEHYNKFDFGFATGFTFAVKNFVINSTYFRSIKPIRTIDFTTVSHSITNTVYRNNSLEFSIGYQLDLRKFTKDK